MANQPEIEIKVRIEGLVAERIFEKLDLILGIQGNMHREIKQLQLEVTKLANQDAALTQVVTDLVSAFTDNTTAIQAEITAIQGAITPGDDPVVDTAVVNLQALVDTIKASTAAAQAAIAPPADGSTPAV
jgi:hypothetical protein